ncbi:nuclear transport factor 2 family protein [Actinomadura opuntiae]|uniref:nuclear transport factor 2 family protein n=1 Tax=Actinomadura sp. OS1-43 TaxID=604315 RepID=UPI00255AFAEF|nr:nuclear transport factor 2 family protein [Actinomadura sp. OS1-43]MDL4818393.1 nuclear transport factor 2 family protein [Actinomadura sp. OS1-43]
MAEVAAERSLEQRTADLERVEAIKALKYRYWRACDGKDPAAFRDCFVSGPASIDYGSLGTFEDADELARVFAEIALSKVDGRYAVLDMHHGFHPVITLIDDVSASGVWTLRFRQVNRVDGTELLMTAEYDDAYVLEDGRWKMAKSHVRPLWTIRRPLPEGTDVNQLGWP